LPNSREARSRSFGHFQQLRAVAVLTRRAETSKSEYLAPQMWLSSRSLSGERFPTAVRVATQWKWLPISRLITRKYRKSDGHPDPESEAVRRASLAKVFVSRRLDCVRTPCHLCRWLSDAQIIRVIFALFLLIFSVSPLPFASISRKPSAGISPGRWARMERLAATLGGLLSVILAFFWRQLAFIAALTSSDPRGGHSSGSIR
jgi:hypothetical protein